MVILSKGCRSDNFESHNFLKLSFFGAFVEFCWLWICSWIKLSWHSCSIWDKPGWLNSFWQFLCEGLSSLNLKRFYYSYAWCRSLCERSTSFCMALTSRKFCTFLLIFYFIQCLTSFYSNSDLLCLYAQFLILFHLT